MAEQLLSGLKVVECGNFISAAHCAKMMADLGAEVDLDAVGQRHGRRGHLKPFLVREEPRAPSEAQGPRDGGVRPVRRDDHIRAEPLGLAVEDDPARLADVDDAQLAAVEEALGPELLAAGEIEAPASR